MAGARRRATRRGAARARRRRHARQRARVDTAPPGRLQQPAAAGADAARRGRAGGACARRRRHPAHRGAVLGQPRHRELLAEHGVHCRATCVPPRASAGSSWRTSPARTAASTGRTAVSRPGSRPTIRRRCSTRRRLGGAQRPCRHAGRAGRARRGRRRRRLPRHRARVGGGLWSRRGHRAPRRPRRRPERRGRASAVPNTVPAAPLCTSRRRTATWPRSARCSTSAPTRRSATASTAARPPTGRPTAGMSPPARCLPPDSVRDSLQAVVSAVASSTLTDTHPKGGDVRSC